jgi:SAM-dependent methyltransferase
VAEHDLPKVETRVRFPLPAPRPLGYTVIMSDPILFKKQPTFAELWDACVYQLLYNISDYKQDIEKLFAQLDVTKDSAIIDVAAGGGFPALDLVKDGYNFICTDGSPDEVDLFNEKSIQTDLTVKCSEVHWDNLSDKFPPSSFDFLFCRGNSFIYAAGGWNENVAVQAEKSLSIYRKTLSIFYDLLKSGGWIYLDKFKDSETTHRVKVADIQVGNGQKEELIFWTERFPEQKIRRASMIRKNGDVENAVPNITYDLSSLELEQLFQDVGFKNVQKIELPSEQNFDVWIAQK